MEVKTLSFDEARDACDGFVSRTIKLVTENVDGIDSDKYSLWSHVGVIISKEYLPNVRGLVEGQLYCWEITYTGELSGDFTPDVESGSTKFGVQIRNLHDVIKTYHGKVGVLELVKNPIDRYIFSDGSLESDGLYSLRTLDLKSTLDKFHNKYVNAIYQMNVFQMLAAAYRILRPLRYIMPLSLHWVMCSQLVAQLYKDIGVLSPNIDCRNVIPQDFIEDEENEIAKGTFKLPPIRVVV